MRLGIGVGYGWICGATVVTYVDSWIYGLLIAVVLGSVFGASVALYDRWFDANKSASQSL